MTEAAGETLDGAIEAEVRALYHARYDAYGPKRVDDYLDGLLDIEHHAEHLRQLLSASGPIDSANPPSLLVSGFGAGSEIVAARRLGFGEICGVEVDPFLEGVARRRLAGMPGIHLEVYDGGELPFAEGRFTHLTSSHVVEHASSPARYVAECVRVLAPGGVMSLEFPTRFHWKELHTGLPSFEWLPRPLRNAALLLASARVSPLPAEMKSRYREIFDTHLRQVSLAGVRRSLARTGARAARHEVTRPAPGVVRCVVRKRAGPLG